MLSNITEVCDDPGSAAIRIPSFATVPLSHAFTSAVASIVIKLLAALTGTCDATTIPAAGAFVPFTVASIHVPFAALTSIEPAVPTFVTNSTMLALATPALVVPAGRALISNWINPTYPGAPPTFTVGDVLKLVALPDDTNVSPDTGRDCPAAQDAAPNTTIKALLKRCLIFLSSLSNSNGRGWRPEIQHRTAPARRRPVLALSPELLPA